MPGDYSRKTFDPKNHYIGVLNQQGRVQLDAEWNEQVELTDRRFRAETVDIIGRCVVPKETPDGFKIEVADGTFTIGPGRIYVHGILAENHGKPVLELGSPPGGVISSPPVSSMEFDSVLAEERGTEPVPYEEQPYFPGAPVIPVGSPPGPHLVYIDVWQREVTFLENPGLIEKAVGIDTTARIQTVWQVKVLPDRGDGLTCSTPDEDVPGWDTATLPSAGRLSTKAIGVTEDRDPCLIPLSGGYRGQENRLYRVEIHDGGTQGNGATFKWSRDNTIMASNVTSIKGLDQLIVDRTGFDSVMRFNGGDWVEITDDWREFSGLPGIICKIKEVKDSTQTIILTDTEKLSGGEFPTLPQGQTEPNRHTRIRRWDQSGRVRDSDGNVYHDLDNDPITKGVIPVPTDGNPIILEDGVQITFHTDPSGGVFRVGDYWLFEARAADASVEQLNMEPPKGIHHHYGRLAIVNFPAEETDCRILWPQEGCCTIVVHPGENIQSALDALPDAGGCICLKTGTHTITEPIRIEKSNVVLHGESPGTKVVRSNGINLINISPITRGEKITNIIVEGVYFEVLEITGRVLINIVVYLSDSENVSVKNCGIVVANDPNAPSGSIIPVVEAIAVYVVNSRDIEVNGNDIKLAMYGVWGINSKNIHVSENTITGGVLRHGLYINPIGKGILNQNSSVVGSFTIERNRIENYITGVELGASAERSIISRNEIVRPPTSLTSSDFEKLYAIDVDAPNCFIANNNIDLNSTLYGGIRVTAPHNSVESNHLFCSENLAGRGLFPPLPLGIFVGSNPERQDILPDYSLVRDNTLKGYLDGILVDRTNGVQVIENNISNTKGDEIQARLAITIVNSNNTVITGNQIRNAEIGVFLGLELGKGNRVINNSISDGGFGIVPLVETKLEVSGNVVENMSGHGFGGIWLMDTTTVTHNRFVSCGYSGIATAIGVLFGFGDVSIESCEVVNTGIDPVNGHITNNPTYGINLFLIPSCRVSKNRIAYTDQSNLFRDIGDRALILFGYPSYSGLENRNLSLSNALVEGNVFHGAGSPHLVEFVRAPRYEDLRFEKVTFSNNYCEHVSNFIGDHDQRVTVSFWGRHLIVMGNHIKAAQYLSSMNFNEDGEVALMGNVTTGSIKDYGNSTPTPHNNFNIKL